MSLTRSKSKSNKILHSAISPRLSAKRKKRKKINGNLRRQLDYKKTKRLDLKNSKRCKSVSPRPRSRKKLTFDEYNTMSLSARRTRQHQLEYSYDSHSQNNLMISAKDKMSLSSKRRKEKKMTFELTKTLSADYNDKKPNPQNIRKILVNTKLIEFSVKNPSVESIISSLLSHGWYLPNTTTSNTNTATNKYKKNKLNSKYKCKIHSYIICENLIQTLNYSFQEFLEIDSIEFDWCRQIYAALMMQLTLSQKALLFSIGSNRKTRKKKLAISYYKDCFVGKEGIDWMISNKMVKSREDGVLLGSQMLSNAYISSVNKIDDYDDNDMWYHFHENNINYDISSQPNLVDCKSAPAVVTKPKQNPNYLSISSPSPQSNNDNDIAISIPITPPSGGKYNYNKNEIISYYQSPVATVKAKVKRTASTSAVIVSCKEEELIERFNNHNDIMSCLVSMTLLSFSDSDLNEYRSFIIQAFYLPTAQNGNKYVCKIVDYVSFIEGYEAIEFILTEFWEELFAQKLYDNLIKLLNNAQKCKLFSICIDTKTYKYHLKKYKKSFHGYNACKLLIKLRIVHSIFDALIIGNNFKQNGLIKHITSRSSKTIKFENNKNIYYQFNISEIDNQSQRNNLIYGGNNIEMFNDHNKIIQNLISMGLSPETEIELLLDLQKAFYLPRTGTRPSIGNGNGNKQGKFVSKYSNNLIFDNIIEALHYLLIECWDANYSQIIYKKLLTKLSIAQKAKLFSLAIKRQIKKKKFKKYTNCFIASSGIKWFVDKGFVQNNTIAIQLGNKFRENGFIKSINSDKKNKKHVLKYNKFENNNLYYQLNDIEINKQCIMESYNKTNLLYNNKSKSNVNITPVVYTSQSISFPNIDYDDLNMNDKQQQQQTSDDGDDDNDTCMDDDDDDDEDDDKKSLSFGSSLQSLHRTDPIAIKETSLSHMTKQILTHPELYAHGYSNNNKHGNDNNHNINTSLLSNMAVHNGGYMSNTSTTRLSNISLVTSVTQQIQFGCLPDDDEDDIDDIDIDIDMNYTDDDDDDEKEKENNKHITNLSMATRITKDISDTQDTQNNDDDDDVDDDNDGYHISLRHDQLSLKSKLLLYPHTLLLNHQNTSISHMKRHYLHNDQSSSQSSASASQSTQSTGTVQCYHNINNSTLSLDLDISTMDDDDNLLFAANPNHDNDNSYFDPAYLSYTPNQYTPNQIGK